MSLAHNHVTKLLSLVTDGLLLSNFGSKNSSFIIEVYKELVHWG